MEFFILFVIAHLLGDYVFQPYYFSKKKKEKIKYVLLHSLIYTALSFLVVLMIKGTIVKIMFPVIIFTSHLVIDFLRIKFDRKHPGVKAQFISFIFDQALHILIFLLLVQGLDQKNTSSFGIAVYDWFVKMIAPLSLNYFLKLVIAYLIILSPSSVFIKHFFNLFFKKDLCDEGENKAGSIIGKLERLVILTLGIMGLYTAVALVFTAKSIARYKQLEEKEFAERYLIGTLLSLFIAVLGIIFVRM